MSDPLWLHGLKPARLLCPWDSPGKNTGVEKKKKEYWSGLPFPPPGDLPDPGIEPESPASPALAGGFFTTPVDHPPWRSLHLCLPTPAAWLPHPQLLPTCSLGYSHPTTPSVSFVSWWDLTALSDEMLPVMCTDPGARLFPQTQPCTHELMSGTHTTFVDGPFGSTAINGAHSGTSPQVVARISPALISQRT